MSDIKKYYYMRLKEDFFDSDEIRVIESMPDGYLYTNILLKMYLKSLKSEGRLMLNNIIPYNLQMIASVTGHQVGTVERALDVFKQLGFIEVLDNGAIYMLEIQNYIGESTTKADRQREYDRRISDEKKKSARNLEDSGKISSPEIEIKKEIEIKIEKEIEKPISADAEPLPVSRVAELYNQICTSYPQVRSLSEARKKAIKARLRVYSLDDIKTVFEKAEASDFLRGGNARNWTASFDWLLKDANMAKVLDGNYDNKNSGFTAPNGNDDLYNRGLREWAENA